MVGALPLAFAAGGDQIKSVKGERVKTDKTIRPVKSASQISKLPDEVKKLIRKGDFSLVESSILGKLKEADLSVENPEVLQMAEVLEVIRTTGADIMTKMATEGKGKFLDAFLNDQQWMELYLGAGLVPWHNDVGLGILAEIWKKDGKSADFDRYKPLACALASVWGGGEAWQNPALQKKSRTTHNPYWRYKFFKKRHKNGLLYPGFASLRPWELRFVVGIPGQDWDDQSYAWAAENINLPWSRYTGACWAAPYTGTNAFGYNVQTPEYSMPWPNESSAQSTQLNGGVCGSLSHLGAVAAMAHGIPAYTVGQPGHCAYAIRLRRGEWLGGFGGPDGGMHNFIFSQGVAPTSFRLMEAVFGNNSAIDKAYRQSFIARACDAVKSPKAKDAWKKAVDLSPLHPDFRQEYQKHLLADGLNTQSWLAYETEMLKAYEGHGFAASDVLKNVEETAVKSMSDSEKQEWFSSIHHTFATTPGSWKLKMEPILQNQISKLQSDEAKTAFLGNVLSIHMSEGAGANLGQVFEWAVKEYVQKGKEKIFAEAFVKATDTASSKSGSSKDEKSRAESMKKAYGKAIVAAEDARSLTAFRALTTAASKKLGLDKRGENLTEKLPGTLVSDKGYIRFSSNSGNWGNPETHGEILTRRGGSSHSEREKNVEAIVTLESPVDLSGVIIRKIDSNEWRMKKATVSVSTDGATWFPIAETDNMPKVWVVQPQKRTQAGYVKVSFHNEGNGEFAHISNFLVYKR